MVTDNPHTETLPSTWEEKLSNKSEFLRLLLIRIVREEKVVFAIRRYVQASLGWYCFVFYGNG
jgi:dynein heavy chain